MTEQEWNKSGDPAAMLQHLTHHNLASDRKLRWFACACVRRVWHLLTDERSRRAVEVAEQYADGEAGADELRWAMDAAHAYASEMNAGYESFPWLGFYIADARPEYWQQSLSSAIGVIREQGHSRVSAELADLLREIIGNPFAPVVLPAGPKCERCKGTGIDYDDHGGNIGRTIPCDVCKGTGYQPCPYLTDTVKGIAQAAYDNRNDDGTLQQDRLAVLSDALEDSGGDNADLLFHLRSQGPHVRGCWALDLVLGKS